MGRSTLAAAVSSIFTQVFHVFRSPRKLLSLNKKLPAFWKKVQKKYVAGLQWTPNAHCQTETSIISTE